MARCYYTHVSHDLAQLYMGWLWLESSHARSLIRHLRRCTECLDIAKSLFEQIDARRTRSLSPLSESDMVRPIGYL